MVMILFLILPKKKTESGDYFSDQDLVDHSRFLYFAAFDTTTTLLSHLVMYAAIDQDLQEKLRQECLSLNKETSFLRRSR